MIRLTEVWKNARGKRKSPNCDSSSLYNLDYYIHTCIIKKKYVKKLNGLETWVHRKMIAQ